MHRHLLLDLLLRYQDRYPSEHATVERFTRFVRDHARCFERDLWAGHVTGSAWLVNDAGDHVLLTHHRKLGRWLQLGGHSDGEADPVAVALKEAREESGLEVVPIHHAIFDLDVHEIPARKLDPAHFHFDVRFALRVVGSDDFRVSAESLDLAWVPIAQLHEHTDEPSMLRMADKWRRLS